MARFCVYRLKNDTTFALDVQADLLSDLDTRSMIPLLRATDISRRIAQLNPAVEIEGEIYFLATQFMSVIPARMLGDMIADLRNKGDEITAALDFLFQGF